MTLNAENSWTAKFAQVDVKKDGTRIKYEVKSTEKEGYTVSVSGNILDEEGLTLNYKHVPATVNISAKAAWNDAKNQDGIRPTDTLVQLYADGEVLGDKAVLESGKSWTKTWTELPKYKAGKEIAYKVVASAVSGYSVKVSGDVEKGYTVTYAHSVAKTKVTVKNTWNDLNNVVDSRPSKLVVEIYANGKATGKRVTLTSANKWTATVSNLNKKSAGKVISYTGKVVGAPSGYSISIKSANGTVNVTSKYTKNTKKLNLKLSKTSYVYTGKNLKPTVTVYNGKKKVANKYYTVPYKNNKNTGYATVIVKGKGKFAKYAGKASFTIRPKQMRKPSVKSTGKKTLAVGWVRDAQATKYVVQYSQNNKFRGKTTKSVTINKNTISKTTLKGLASGRYYYVRVRSYKVANGKNIYAPSWSQVVKVRVKYRNPLMWSGAAVTPRLEMRRKKEMYRKWLGWKKVAVCLVGAAMVMQGASMTMAADEYPTEQNEPDYANEDQTAEDTAEGSTDSDEDSEDQSTSDEDTGEDTDEDTSDEDTLYEKTDEDTSDEDSDSVADVVIDPEETPEESEDVIAAEEDGEDAESVGLLVTVTVSHIDLS